MHGIGGAGQATEIIEGESIELATGKSISVTDKLWVARVPGEDPESGANYEIPYSASLTVKAFESSLPGIGKYLVAFALVFFAFSTMISWSYYGQQALGFLCKENPIVIGSYKVVFCGCVVVGAAAGLENVLNLSDSLFFAMVIPNLMGLYLLLPVVKRELHAFKEHAAEIDAKGSSE